MSKKEIVTRPQAAPKSIKITTLFKGIAVTIAITASFIGGWHTSSLNSQAFDSNVRAEASAIVTQLKADAK